MRHQAENVKVFAAWHKDEDIRRESSSGGAFSAIAKAVLAQGGFVVGAAYAGNMRIEHVIIDSEADLQRLRLSKYAQSYVGRVLKDIRTLLQEGKLVLFTGTPCQVAGAINLYGGKYPNLITADIICHGVPSPMFLQKYLGWLGKRFGNITHINFRDKRKGWYDNLRVVRTDNGKTHAMRGRNDAYWVAFNRDSCLMESCYHCTAQGFPRSSDLTLADFWRIGHAVPFGHKEEIEKGVSMILVHNPKVQPLIDGLTEWLYMEERTADEAIGGNLSGVQSHTRPAERTHFYADLSAMDFETFRRLHLRPNFREHLIKIFRERLPFFVIKAIRLRKQK